MKLTRGGFVVRVMENLSWWGQFLSMFGVFMIYWVMFLNGFGIFLFKSIIGVSTSLRLILIIFCIEFIILLNKMLFMLFGGVLSMGICFFRKIISMILFTI